MAGEWRDCILGDMIELKRGYDLPERERRAGTVPIISSSGPNGFHDQVKVKGPGVVTGRYGTIGQVFYVPSDFWPLNTTLYVRDFKGNDPRFVSYFLRSLNYLAYSDKAAVPGVNRNHLHQAEVHVPKDVGEQRAIAHILGTLDDKIELNRRMSETLEQMARALFKAWFVDFEPVRAKCRGARPCAPTPPDAPTQWQWPAHILDLFPDRLVDSELGETPEGWGVDTMGNQFRITMGQSPPGSTYNENGEGIPFYQGRVDFGFRFPARRVFCTAPTRFAEAGDTLVTVRAPVGDVNMALERCAIGRGVGAVRHTTGSRSYTYYFVRSLRPVFENFEAEGTVFGAINKEGFGSLKCVVPPGRLIERFEALCKPLDEQIEKTEIESRTLAALRDALLPKLVRGEIRVKDAERFLKERGL